VSFGREAMKASRPLIRERGDGIAAQVLKGDSIMAQKSQLVYAVRRSSLYAIRKGEFSLQHDRQDLFCEQTPYFGTLELARAAAAIAAEEEAEDGGDKLSSWLVVGDPNGTGALTIFEAVPVRIALVPDPAAPPAEEEGAEGDDADAPGNSLDREVRQWARRARPGVGCLRLCSMSSPAALGRSRTGASTGICESTAASLRSYRAVPSMTASSAGSSCAAISAGT
jgi:hypothetical protein